MPLKGGREGREGEREGRDRGKGGREGREGEREGRERGKGGREGREGEREKVKSMNYFFTVPTFAHEFVMTSATM